MNHDIASEHCIKIMSIKFVIHLGDIVLKLSRGINVFFLETFHHLKLQDNEEHCTIGKWSFL